MVQYYLWIDSQEPIDSGFGQVLKSEVYEQQQQCFEKEEKIIFGWEILMKIFVLS